MPADFDACQRAGGKMRTVEGKQYGCGPNEYRHVCIDKSGKMHMGEIKKKVDIKPTKKS